MNGTRCPRPKAMKHLNTFPLPVRLAVQLLAHFEYVYETKRTNYKNSNLITANFSIIIGKYITK